MENSWTEKLKDLANYIQNFGPKEQNAIRNMYRTALGTNEYKTSYEKQNNYWVGLTKWKDSENGHFELRTNIHLEKNKNSRKFIVVYSSFLNGEKVNETRLGTKNKRDTIAIHESVRETWFSILFNNYSRSQSLEKVYKDLNFQPIK